MRGLRDRPVVEEEGDREGGGASGERGCERGWRLG